MRLFLAVEPSLEARGDLRDLLERVRRELGRWETCVRWVGASRMHLTLHFLGDVDADGLVRLRAALGDRLPGPAFNATFAGAGAFEDRGRVRTIWIGVRDGRDRLVEAHREVGRRLAGAGFPVETRPFSPHLTLGRIRPEQSRRTTGLRDAVAALDLPPIAWRISSVVLFSSGLREGQPLYEPLQQLRFDAAER